MEFGIGIYTPRDAAALLHEDVRTVRRWAFGYTRTRPSGPVVYPPVIRTELPELEGQRALTFVELVELLYVRAFHRAGASMRAIEEAARVAARLHGSEHPFALREVYVDPDRVFYGAVRESDGSEALVELRGHGQHAIPLVVRPYLEQLDFDADDVAERWWPMGRGVGVVIDPRFSFGAPVLEGTGIRAETLSGSYHAERAQHGDRTIDHVAWMYSVAPQLVETSLAFERWLKAA
jgi:uncharacterized protein (DUF433 family)